MPAASMSATDACHDVLRIRSWNCRFLELSFLLERLPNRPPTNEPAAAATGPTQANIRTYLMSVMGYCTPGSDVHTDNRTTGPR